MGVFFFCSQFHESIMKTEEALILLFEGKRVYGNASTEMSLFVSIVFRGHSAYELPRNRNDIAKDYLKFSPKCLTLCDLPLNLITRCLYCGMRSIRRSFNAEIIRECRWYIRPAKVPQFDGIVYC